MDKTASRLLPTASTAQQQQQQPAVLSLIKRDWLFKERGPPLSCIMRGFNYANMSRILPEGDTPFDRVIDAMQYLPTVDPDKYQKAFRQLATKNGSNIRGIYGEAVTFKRLKDPDEVLASGTNLRANPDSLEIGDDVYWHGRSGVQGPDIDGTLDGALDDPDELVSRSLKLETSGGRPLFVEVKNYTSNYSPAKVKAQTKKHLETKIEDLLDEGGPSLADMARRPKASLALRVDGGGVLFSCFAPATSERCDRSL